MVTEYGWGRRVYGAFGVRLQGVLVVERTVRAVVPDDPDCPLVYEVAVRDGEEGKDTKGETLSWTQRRTLAALGMAPDARTIQEIGDLLAADGTRKPLKHTTIRVTLNELAGAGCGRSRRCRRGCSTVVEGMTGRWVLEGVADALETPAGGGVACSVESKTQTPTPQHRGGVASTSQPRAADRGPSFVARGCRSPRR